MSRTRSACVLLLSLTAACSDSTPSSPVAPQAPGLDRAAFRLVIDVTTGHVSVSSPSAQRTLPGLSLSLIGSEAVALHATNCVWSSISSNSRQKRCTFNLALENRLSNTSLVTPTTFPQPPQGTTGLLVFPYTAAALGVPGGGATPSTDWDNAPANFFNDFSGCSVGKSGDCYRSESYPGPLYPGETTAPRSVGFDVDKNAQSVAVYIVVAADLRDDPVQEQTLTTTNSVCGYIEFMGGSSYSVNNSNSATTLLVGGGAGSLSFVRRGFCGFALPNVHIVGATLRMFQSAVAPSMIASGVGPVVDHVDFGSTLEAGDFDAPALQANIGFMSTSTTVEYKELDVTAAVRDDQANGRATSQFRLRTTAPIDGLASFDTPTGANPPQLVISYRNP